MTFTYQIKSLAATKTLALILSKLADANLYLLLSGELASGKTQLTKFIGAELGVQEVINSPTFVILNQYQTRYSWKLVHIDAYRLDESSDFQEYFELTEGNFTIIEWPEKIRWNFHSLTTISIDWKITNDVRELTLTTNNLAQQKAQMLFDEIKKQLY